MSLEEKKAFSLRLCYTRERGWIFMTEQAPFLPMIADGEDKSSPLKNRIRKNYRHVRKWANTDRDELLSNLRSGHQRIPSGN